MELELINIGIGALAAVAGVAVFWLTTFCTVQESEGKPTKLGWVAFFLTALSLGSFCVAVVREASAGRAEAEKAQALVFEIQKASRTFGPRDIELELELRVPWSPANYELPAELSAAALADLVVCVDIGDSSVSFDEFNVRITKRGGSRGSVAHRAIRIRSGHTQLPNEWPYESLDDLSGFVAKVHIPKSIYLRQDEDTPRARKLVFQGASLFVLRKGWGDSRFDRGGQFDSLKEMLIELD